MAIFRVEKNKNYTVMSNYHLRDKNLSLKAKGLLSQILSLPDDWDYTLAGLASINKEKIDAIRTAIQELERFGYLKRSRIRHPDGKLGGAEYIVFEQPQSPTLDFPIQEESDDFLTNSPTLDFPTQVNAMLEKTMQLNTDIPIKEKIKKDSFREIEISINQIFKKIFKRQPDKSFISNTLKRIKANEINIEQIIDIIEKQKNKNIEKPEAYILGYLNKYMSQKKKEELEYEEWEIEWLIDLENHRIKAGEVNDTSRLNELEEMLANIKEKKNKTW